MCIFFESVAISKSKYFEKFEHKESVAMHGGTASRNVPVTQHPLLVYHKTCLYYIYE